MKNLWVLALVGLTALGSAAVIQAQATSGATEKAILALESQWIQADRTNNPDLAAQLLAEQYVSTWIDGTVLSKAQTLAAAKARKYTSADDEDVKVTVFGNTAIVTGGYKGKGTESGKPFEEHARWTDTWVKMPSGKWQCVATQYTAIKT
jgi:ketosteroid isomerase-like protein